jgi:hypothetical protein
MVVFKFRGAGEIVMLLEVNRARKEIQKPG